jgi:exopolyphosphatase/guanosine-5'-triphosphate,3'-diphosphate pyrophosphatase
VADIERELDGCGVDLASAGTVVGVAGTVTTVGAGVLDLPAYDREAIDQSTPRVREVREYVARLLGMTVAERRALPFMASGREDVIGAGALILDRVLVRTRAERLVVSESDILDGIAWSLVDPSGP